jgi:hypothetical protein
MNIPRRSFIKAGIVAAVCAGIPLKEHLVTGQQQGGRRQPEGYFPIPVEVQNDPINYYTRATFAPYVKSTFKFHLGGTSWRPVTLTEVKDLCPKTGKEPVTTLGECFSLVFMGMPKHTLPQKTYTVYHPALGKFSLFIVPVGKDKRWKTEYYQAIINRRLP